MNTKNQQQLNKQSSKQQARTPFIIKAELWFALIAVIVLAVIAYGVWLPNTVLFSR